MRRSNLMYFDILSGCHYFWFCAANICVYFQYLFMHYVCANIFGAIVFNLRFKIDVVVIVIWSNVIIIILSSLQVSTASLPHNREPCEIKVVSNHTCSLHTWVCPGSRRVRVCLSGFRRQEISSTPGGFLKCPIPVRVCAEQTYSIKIMDWPYNGLLYCPISVSRTILIPLSRCIVIFNVRVCGQ